jgi:RNA polymerase sigma-70 factor (ECF subfamily)
MGRLREANPPTRDKQRVEHAADLPTIVARAAEGDVDALRTLFDRYGERVRRYVRLRLGRVQDAEDAVQDVFIAVWRGLPGFRYEHEGSFPGWLFGIARHVVGQHRRRSDRAQLVSIQEMPESTMEFEGTVVSRRLLVAELQRLPEAQREAVVLRFIVGLSLRETAAALGRSERAVTALQLRALDGLKRRIGGSR